MKPNEFEFSFDWIDLVILALLVVGLFRGRKRGMSEEMLDVLKWIGIVVVAAFVYRPGGELLAHSTMFSLLGCYVVAYAFVVFAFVAIFSFVRQQVGNKLVSSDVFGKGEYYLGMAAGMVRYACVILVAMAFLNARYYSPQELMASQKFQNDNFGDIRFPTLGDVQKEVFQDSFTGRLVREYMPATLIRPTSPEDKGLGADNAIFRQREGRVNDILDRR